MGKRTFEDIKDNVIVYLKEEKEIKDIREIYDFLLRKELIGGHMHMSTQRLAGLMSYDSRFKNIGKPGFKGKWGLNES